MILSKTEALERCKDFKTITQRLQIEKDTRLHSNLLLQNAFIEEKKKISIAFYNHPQFISISKYFIETIHHPSAGEISGCHLW